MPRSVRGVLNEYAQGVLHSGSSTGPVVKKHSQAIAIALSEQRQQGKHASAAATTRMHPAMHQRAQMTKEAHAHLSRAVREYHHATPQQKLMMGNHHVNLRLGKAK